MTILALGGGGFDSDNPLPALDRYFLGLTGKARPKICLIPTATGDSVLRTARFLRAASLHDCVPSVLELFSLKVSDITAFLLEQDAIYVSGGNTRNMLVLWREWGVDLALRQAGERGVVLGGTSAGANCWFDAFSTDSNPGRLSAWPGMGWIKGSFCPHFDEEADREPSLRDMMIRGELAAGYAADGGAGILFRNEEPEGVVVARPGKGGYRVSLDAQSQFKKEKLPTLVELPTL